MEGVQARPRAQHRMAHPRAGRPHAPRRDPEAHRRAGAQGRVNTTVLVTGICACLAPWSRAVPRMLSVRADA